MVGLQDTTQVNYGAEPSTATTAIALDLGPDPDGSYAYTVDTSFLKELCARENYEDNAENRQLVAYEHRLAIWYANLMEKFNSESQYCAFWLSLGARTDLYVLYVYHVGSVAGKLKNDIARAVSQHGSFHHPVLASHSQLVLLLVTAMFLSCNLCHPFEVMTERVTIILRLPVVLQSRDRLLNRSCMKILMVSLVHMSETVNSIDISPWVSWEMQWMWWKPGFKASTSGSILLMLQSNFEACPNSKLGSNHYNYNSVINALQSCRNMLTLSWSTSPLDWMRSSRYPWYAVTWIWKLS